MLVTLFSQFTLDMSLLVQLDVEFVGLFLKAFDSLRVNRFHPGHFLILSFELLFIPSTYLFLDILNILKSADLHFIALFLHLPQSFAHRLDLLIFTPLHLSYLLHHLNLLLFQALILKHDLLKPLLQVGIDFIQSLKLVLFL